MTSGGDPIVSEIERTFGAVTYTHKTQEKAGDRQQTWATVISWTNVFVIGMTALAAFLAPLVAASWVAWLAACCGAAGLIFTVVQLSFDAAKKAAAHRGAAKSYLALRNDYLRLLADVKAGALGTDELRERRNVLGWRLEQIDNMAPSTSARDYSKARAAIQGTEELTFSEEELDHLLPTELRSSGPTDRS